MINDKNIKHFSGTHNCKFNILCLTEMWNQKKNISSQFRMPNYKIINQLLGKFHLNVLEYENST